MDTTLPLPFLPHVELGNEPAESKQRLTRNQLSYLGCVYLTSTNTNIDTLLQFLQSHISIEAFVDASGFQSADDIVSILDAGAQKVFVNPEQLESLQTYGDRVLPIVSVAQGISSTLKGGALIQIGSDISAPKAILEKLTAEKASPIFFLSTSTDLDSVVKAAKEFNAIPILPATQLTIFKNPVPGQISIPELICGSWTSDRNDKLIPTVVTDERGIALGLVYSSQESLAESLNTGTGVYQSRKRGLWYKGATSGDTQELVRISLDCDQDCLKFVVRQHGRGMLQYSFL